MSRGTLLVYNCHIWIIVYLKVGKCLKGDSGAAPCRAFEDPVMKFSWEISTGKRPQLFPRAFEGSVCVAGGVDLVGAWSLVYLVVLLEYRNVIRRRSSE